MVKFSVVQKIIFMASFDKSKSMFWLDWLISKLQMFVHVEVTEFTVIFSVNSPSLRNSETSYGENYTLVDGHIHSEYMSQDLTLYAVVSVSYDNLHVDFRTF